jgi:hypothetical protein
MVTVHNFEVLAKRSHSSPVAEHKMADSMRGSPQLLWRGAAVMTCTAGHSRTGLISVARHISKSVAPRMAERRTAGGGAPATAPGVKFNARDINRFAIKRPFAAVIIYMVRRTKAAT